MSGVDLILTLIKSCSALKITHITGVYIVTSHTHIPSLRLTLSSLLFKLR